MDCVPTIFQSWDTALSDKPTADYSALTKVAKRLSDILSPNSLVIVESTIEPGFIEDEIVSIISGKGNSGSIDFEIVNENSVENLISVNLPITGGWQSWSTSSTSVVLNKGVEPVAE